MRFSEHDQHMYFRGLCEQVLITRYASLMQIVQLGQGLKPNEVEHLEEDSLRMAALSIRVELGKAFGDNYEIEDFGYTPEALVDYLRTFSTRSFDIMRNWFDNQLAELRRIEGDIEDLPF